MDMHSGAMILVLGNPEKSCALFPCFHWADFSRSSHRAAVFSCIMRLAAQSISKLLFIYGAVCRNDIMSMAGHSRTLTLAHGGDI